MVVIETSRFRATGEILYFACPYPQGACPPSTRCFTATLAPKYPNKKTPRAASSFGLSAASGAAAELGLRPQTVLAATHLPLKPKARQGD
jgi:hypothetical protein